MSRELSGVCKLINKDFMAALDHYFGFTTQDTIFTQPELQEAFKAISTLCGFEKLGDSKDGKPPVYVQFPMRTAALIKACKIHPGAIFENIVEGMKEREFDNCEIIEEHGDGDLTVKAGEESFVITTEGRIFKEVKAGD